MRWFIHGVWQYRRDGNTKGVVMDMYHMAPRLFASEHRAKEYARLSQFKDPKIEVHRK